MCFNYVFVVCMSGSNITAESIDECRRLASLASTLSGPQSSEKYSRRRPIDSAV